MFFTKIIKEYQEAINDLQLQVRIHDRRLDHLENRILRIECIHLSSGNCPIMPCPAMWNITGRRKTPVTELFRITGSSNASAAKKSSSIIPTRNRS
jgi:hypothetical protein